jgi:N6-L-threonylcarbamoyladenine synthase
MNVLGIETSCDETAAAVIRKGTTTLSNVVASQVELHARYGGIVPEVASRQHVLAIIPVINQALEQAGLTLSEIDGIAVTNGPGLAGALLVGVNVAKALAFALDVPVLGVNHLEGHIYATWLSHNSPEENPGFPILCLVASGGHTDLILMEQHGRYTLLGRTRDDAAGEAFDKAARILGLGYPGGPAIQQAAVGVDTKDRLPRAWIRGTLDFSFSGVKTALLHRAQLQGIYPVAKGSDPLDKNLQLIKREAAAEFQEALVDVMVVKTLKAAEQTRSKGIILGGGVAANILLREKISRESSVPVLIPPVSLCTDNAAMIAACAYFHFLKGERDGLDMDVYPSLQLG